MVYVFLFLNVILLNSKLESRVEEQDGVVVWWLRKGVGYAHSSLSGIKVIEVRAVIKEKIKISFHG